MPTSAQRGRDALGGLDRRRMALLLSARYGAIIAMAVSVVVAAFLYPQDETGTLVWLAVRVVVSLGMIAAFVRIERNVDDDPHRSITAFAMVSAFGGAAWGLLPVIVRPEEPEWQAIMVIALIGSLSVMASGASPDRRAFLGGAVPEVVIGLIGLATFRGSYSVVLCLALALAAVYAYVIFAEANRVLTESFAADQKNENLVLELGQHRTDLHEINERLHALVERQSMTLEERDALIAAVSHDLRSPLAAISLMSQTLAQRGSTMNDDQRREIAERISADARHTVEVLADLASAQRLRVQDVLATRSVIDVGSLLAATVAQHSSDLSQVQVGTIDLDGQAVTADQVLVRRILDNLVSNALKHTPSGTTIEVGATRVGDDVLLHVDDDGPGLPETLRESVFDAYVRGTSSTVRPGSGVGLFLVRTFAQLHGGRAWWEPSPIGGSRFVVSLPQAPGDQMVTVESSGQVGEVVGGADQ